VSSNNQLWEGNTMNELKIEQADAIEAPVLAAADFTDELSDEALDRAAGVGGA
jgi:hypothetical protein